MRLSNKLFSLIYRAFDRDPAAFLGLRVRAAGGLTWVVDEAVLTLTPALGGGAAPLSIDLSLYDLSALATFIAGQGGYTVSDLVGPDRSGLSAECLIDGAGDIGTSNGDHLYAWSNPNWAWIEAMSAELEAARVQVGLMPAEMATVTAHGEWLDLLGVYYKVPRILGETDTQYGPRIPAEVLLPKGNNKAIEAVISSVTGQDDARVVDVVTFGPGLPRRDGTILYDGTWFHTTVAQPIYGLFDVTLGFDLFGSGDLAAFQVTIAALIERLRDAGTFLRSLVVGGSAISDTVGFPTDSFGALAGVVTLTDTPTAPTDPTFGGIVTVTLADAIAAAGDASTLLVAFTSLHNGARRRDGSICYASGTSLPGTIEAYT
jgi:hypothetical protein